MSARLALWSLALLAALLTACSLTPIQMPGLEGSTPKGDAYRVGIDGPPSPIREAGSQSMDLGTSADRRLLDGLKDGVGERRPTEKGPGDGPKTDLRKTDAKPTDAAKKG
jgi:hypothetical protein